MTKQQQQPGNVSRTKGDNLSDFALFLSVMKNKKAYQNVLEIIMDEAIDLEEVKVEEVILNQKGKRAIRLDAWARSTDDRQFAVEMQNDTEKDDVRRRSRFYQGLVDSPILKSGKKTLYKMLPATVIIFITQEDIFGRDLAKYTFTERCKEIADLELGDGTTKIFLNMSSKNGRSELISLLQYMKYTDMENPEIEEKTKRLVELDEIVRDVKSSEEWEDARMSILSEGLARGQEIGKEIGKEQGQILQQIKTILRLQERGYSPEQIMDAIDLSKEDIEQICKWKAEHPEDGAERIYEILDIGGLYLDGTWRDD